MLLSFSDGTPFATGVAEYVDKTAGWPNDSRIWLSVMFQDQNAMAIVDTGAPWVVCSHELAAQIGLTANPNDIQASLRIRGAKYDGHLVRFELTIPATEGEDLVVQATAFVPDLSSGESWNNPDFLGLAGCLERLRFAVDPGSHLFYFGKA